MLDSEVLEKVAKHRARHSVHLDPSNWDAFREQAHELLDWLIDEQETIGTGRVWTPQPDCARREFDAAAPRTSRSLAAVISDVTSLIAPYATGNRHPRFMGWVHGAGTPYGMLAEMVSGALNLNCGGRNHVGLVVENQIVRWMSELLGYPKEATGLLVTGSSMANLLAVIIARTEALGEESRTRGLQQNEGRLIGYCSSEAHGCIPRAFEVSGIGSANLRGIPVTPTGGLDLGVLATAIAEDRALGHLPFFVAGTAGTVNTGAMDPLAELAQLAAKEKLWFHVDGAIGAVAAFDSELRSLLTGIELADSIAMDFHKCCHVPYDAGLLLVRSGQIQEKTFKSNAAYLQRSDGGLAAGVTWPCDLGVDLSRGFRALKVWMTLSVLGTERIGAAMLQNRQMARYMAELIEQSTVFELKAPVPLNIVCFGVHGRSKGDINRAIVTNAQISGDAAPSWTTIDGEDVIRCALVNHRTTSADVKAVVECLMRIAGNMSHS